MKNAKETLYDLIYENIIKERLDTTIACKMLAEILIDFDIKTIERDNKVNGLDENIKIFLDEKERFGLSNRTINTYRLQLNMFSEFLPDKQIQQISKEDIKKFLYHREDNYNVSSTNTLETIRAILRVFFDWLVEEKKIETNPVRKIKAYKVKDVEIEHLDEKEVEELKASCKSLRERMIVELFLSTGCKLSELNNMKIDDINFKEGTVEIKGDGKRNRVVLLSQEAADLVQEYLKSRSDEVSYLVISERQPYKSLSNRGIQREISKVHKRTNIKKNVSPQILRHTFAKTMIEKGVPIDKIQSLLGHSIFSNTSETYIKLTSKNIHQVLKGFFAQPNNR